MRKRIARKPIERDEHGERILSAETQKMRRLEASVAAAFEHPLYDIGRFTVINDEHGFWDKLEFLLPMPPSLNNWVRTFKGVAHTTPAGKIYMNKAGWILKELGIHPSPSRLGIYVRLFGLPANADADNRKKQLLDCMQGIVCLNDYQFKLQTIEDMEVSNSDAPCVRVKVWHLPPRLQNVT